MADLSRGHVWLINLGVTQGHEQAGTRPGLIISVDAFNLGPADLVTILPITSRKKGIPFHVEVRPPEGGLKKKSFVKCEDMRSVSKQRLVKHLGTVSEYTIASVEDRLRILLDL